MATIHEIKERPILFIAPMVRAILEGRKTQTRRIVKPQPSMECDCEPEGYSWVPMHKGRELSHHQCPYGQPGDRLWVRETFSGPWCMGDTPPSKWGRSSRIWYWADGNPEEGDWTRPRPSIHMPRWASRITLEITDVRVERLQDISDADALSEGIYPTSTGLYAGAAKAEFRKLWESINGPESWSANPWVWVIEFKKLEQA